MGVSLERVQNKFACIIGELCSEPLVLSQFAVWLDLRLAEYKAKGSICLECCGDIPSPIWLKGLPLKSQANQDESWPPTSFTHSPDLRRSDQSGDTHPPSSAIMEDRPPWQRQNFTQSPHRTSSSKLPYQQHNTDHSPFRSSIPTGRSPATQRNHGTKAQSQHSPVTLATNSATERLYSPSTQTISSPLDCSQPIGMVGPTDMSEVVIKQEIVDDEPEIVPISLHVHENIQDDSRKRIFSDMEDNGVTGTHSPNKHKKIASTENSAALSMTSPLTQDLSSIIGLQDQNEESLASDNIESDVTIMAYDTIKTDGDDSDIEEISQHGDSSLHPFTLHTQTALQNRDLDFSSIQTDNDSKLSRHSQSGDWTGQSTAEPGTSFVRAAEHVWMTNSRNARPCISGQDKPDIPDTTRHKTASAVAKFQGWLQENTTDCRKMETIPPDQLDDYLVHFFSTVRKIDGGEYSPKSLKTMREGLERYLKEQSYPASITTSPSFSRSREMFRKRVLYLTHLQTGL